MRRLLIACTFALFGASGAAAQVPWDSPFLAPPRPYPGLGIYLVDVGGLGALITYQPSPTSWGFRFGVADAPGEDLAVFGGGDVSGALVRTSANSPVDVDWVFGVGLGVGNDVLLSVPAGLTVGRTFQGEGAQFTPYATPRLILDAEFGEGDDELALELAVDLGVDLRLRPGWTIRFGGTLGDREAIAIGIVF